jgi:hypothetical protein
VVAYAAARLLMLGMRRSGARPSSQSEAGSL